jgi:branched-subunit amino acid transport protein
MNIWLVMFFGGAITYATRLSFIMLLGRREMPLLLQRALRFVPPAVLTAIIFPEVFIPEGKIDLSFGNLRLLAGVWAALVAWRTRNTVLTIVVGMVALWVMMWLAR